MLEVRQGAAGGYFVRTADTGLLLRDFRTLLRLGRVSVAHLLEARMLVEPDVARLAALRATEADLKALGQAIDERSEVPPSGNIPRMLDIAFHRLIADAAKNPVHALLAHALMDLEAELVVPRIELSVDDSREIDRGHRAVFDAVAARDAAGAGAAMEAHIVDVQRRLRRGEMYEHAKAAPPLTGARGGG